MSSRTLACWTLFLLLGAAAAAQPPAAAVPGPREAEAAAAAPSFDPVAATEAWLAKMPPEKRARSDAYFEGGYWLQLWGFLYGLGVAWLLLGTGLSARVRDRIERLTRFRFVQTLLYGLFYILATAVLGFPLALYAGFFREHQYGLATQTLPAWLGDQAKGLGVGLVLGGLAIAAIYAVLRKAPRTWWVWGTVVSVLFLVFVLLIGPVFIDPLFNTYTELEDPALRDPILSMARGNGIPAEKVYVVDASRQTTRVSANVSGILGTMRIALNDNLLRRVSRPGIEMVMGHEMGHYVLNHIYEMLVELGLVILAGFAFLRFAFEPVRRRLGGRWGVRDVADPAGLPLLAALFSVFMFAMTPLLNTVIRVNEAEADLFGLNVSRQPDGFAETALLLGEYRKLHPGPVEEWIFFDHPSGYNRILMAMRWKAEHLDEAAPARSSLRSAL